MLRAWKRSPSRPCAVLWLEQKWNWNLWYTFIRAFPSLIYHCGNQREGEHRERKWKKDNLHISLDTLHHCLSKYQKGIKSKTAYLSNIVSSKSHRPQVLSHIFSLIAIPGVSHYVVASSATCQKFLKFFIEKVSSLRPSQTERFWPFFASIMLSCFWAVWVCNFLCFTGSTPTMALCFSSG